MDKKLLKTRDEIYKRCPSVFWEVSVFAIIFAIALAALEAVVPGLYFITFPFLFFPLLFCTFITLFSIKFGGTVTLKSTFNISLSYFSRGNFGCFKIIKSFLISFLVEIIAAFLFAVILEPIFINIYGSLFTDTVQNMMDTFYNDYDAFLALMETDNPVNLYSMVVLSFSFSSGLISFVYNICFNSLNVYLCANIPNAPANYCTAIFNRFLLFNKRAYRKDFLSLNWPYFALLFFGISAGYAFTILLNIGFSYGLVISTLLGLLCLIPFSPFFFAGMEALFAKYNEGIKSTSMDMTQGFLKSLKDNPNLSEEDKKKIDELLSNGKKAPNDDENNK